VKLTPNERFELDLLDSGRSYGVVLDRKRAVVLLRACHRQLRRLGYKPARNQALEDAYLVGVINENEWEAYKDLIDRRFQRRAREALRLKHRPFAPLVEDGRH